MKKLIQFNSDEIFAHYQKNKMAINRSYGCIKNENLLEDAFYGQQVHIVVNQELNRIQSFKTNYPTLIEYLNENFRPDLDGALDDTEELFTEKGYLKNKKECILKAATINPALLKWMPEKFRSDSEVLLAAVLNDRHSFMGMDCYFNPSAFPYVTENMWNGNCYDYDYLPAIEKLIAHVEEKIALRKNQ